MEFLIFLLSVVSIIGVCWNTNRVNDLYNDFLSLLDERWEDCE